MTSPLFRTSLWRASPAISTHKLTWNHARVKVPCASVDQPSMSNVEVWRKVLLQEPTSRLDFRWGWSPLNVGVPCTVEIKIVLKMWRRKEGTDTLGEHFENWWPYFTNFFEGRCRIFINVYVASSVFGRKTLPEQALLLPMQQDCKTGNLKYMQYVKWHLKIKQKTTKQHKTSAFWRPQLTAVELVDLHVYLFLFSAEFLELKGMKGSFS